MVAQKEKKDSKIKGIVEIQQTIKPILSKHAIKRASIFGSYARQEARNDSDIDILVEFSTAISLLQFVTIQLELEDILGKKVDLVEFSTLKAQLKPQILNEQITIYG